MEGADGGGGADGGAGSSGGVADAPLTDADAQASPLARRLADAALRNAILDELLELRAFCAQRHREMGAEAGAAASLLNAPPAVARATLESVAAARDAAAAAAGLLTAKRARELLLIATSQRYLERLVAALEARGGAQRKLRATLADVDARREAARRQLAGAARELEALQARMRRVKAAAEASISAAYGGRPVHIIGEVNNCL